MPDYLKYDEDGNIVEKIISVDPSKVEGMNVKQVDRETIESIDISLKKIVDGEIVNKTAQEIAAEQKAKDDAKKSKEDKRQAVIDDLKKLGLKDETIHFIINRNR